MRLKNCLLKTLFVCCLVYNACSQTTPMQDLKGDVFLGSTAGDEFIKALLTIPKGSNIDFIRWKLILNPGNSGRFTFSLGLLFGKVRQNSLGFEGGGERLFFTGTYSVSVNEHPGVTRETYHLKSTALPTEILLHKVNDNILHVLSTPTTLMIGNGGWSYTLNRLNTVRISSPATVSTTSILLPLKDTTDRVGVFNGRTNCNPALLRLNGIATPGCQRIKWALTLYQDPKTHLPSTFHLKAIYVGTGNSVYTKVGSWEAIRETKKNSQAIIYILKTNDKTGEDVAFLKGDDNILFFLDKDRNVMVGNADHSFTLNRKRNESTIITGLPD